MGQWKAARREWMSVNEVAAEVGVHPKTVRRWIKGGRLAAYYVAGCVRIDPADLDAVVARRVPVRGGAA